MFGFSADQFCPISSFVHKIGKLEVVSYLQFVSVVWMLQSIPISIASSGGADRHLRRLLQDGDEADKGRQGHGGLFLGVVRRRGGDLANDLRHQRPKGKSGGGGRRQ